MAGLKKDPSKKYKKVTKKSDGTRTILKKKAKVGVIDSAHTSIVKTKEKTKFGPITKSKKVTTKAQNGIGDIAIKNKSGKTKSITLNRQNYSDKSVLKDIRYGGKITYNGNDKAGKTGFKNVIKSAKSDASKNINSYKYGPGGNTKRKLSPSSKTINLEKEQMKNIEKKFKDAEDKARLVQHSKNLNNHVNTLSEEGIRSVNEAGIKAGYEAVKNDYYNHPNSYYRARAGKIPMKTDEGKLRPIPGYLNTDLEGNYTRNFKCGGKVSHKKSCGGKMKKKC